MINNKILDPIVSETHQLWEKYAKNPARQAWAHRFQSCSEFRYGKQWSDEAVEELERRGQAPLVVNRIHPAVETAKALLTSRRPSFRTSPREDSDLKTAKAVGGLIEYIWYISDGDSEMRNVIDNYYVGGLGVMLVYQDPLADNGFGEVKIKSIDPLDLYFDATGRNKFGDDMSNMIYSRLYTRDQAKQWHPLFEKKIDKAETLNNESDRPSTGFNDAGVTIWPEDAALFDEEEELIRGYERYKLVFTEQFRVFEKFGQGGEFLFTESEYKEYVNKPAWLIENAVFTDEKEAMEYAEQLRAKALEQNQRYIAKIETVNFAYLAKMGMIDTIKVTLRTVRMYAVMGDQLLYTRDLPPSLSFYPLVLFQNLGTGTAFPVSDVELAKPLQEYINKIRSLIVAHAASSTNLKVLLPKGSVDRKEFEEEWSKAGAVGIEVDYDLGEPKVVAPVALPNELYANENTAKQDIDHLFGLYEMMMGNTQAAPNTYKATVALDEYGQRKIRSKLSDIESGLTRLGRVVIPFIQQLYTKEKRFRLLQPNNSMSEYVINKRLYDDKSIAVPVQHEIGRGSYDVVVVAGSTLPTNRFAELEIYMESYRLGLIDQVEVLKKTEVFDMEGVLQRTDMIAKLQAQLQQAMDVIKGLKGDLQTREREAFHANSKYELEKFTSKLDGIANKADAAGKLFEARLGDVLSDEKTQKKEKKD